METSWLILYRAELLRFFYMQLELMIMTVANQQNSELRKEIYHLLIWDYTFTSSQVQDLFEGRIDQLGHYDRKKLFAKLIENFPWYTVIQVLPLEIVHNLLTDEVINSLRFPSLVKNYKYAKERLQEAR